MYIREREGETEKEQVRIKRMYPHIYVYAYIYTCTYDLIHVAGLACIGPNDTFRETAASVL